MAITLGLVNVATRNHVIGNRREVVIDGTLDNSYPTGGYTLTPATLGVSGAFDFCDATSSSGHTFGYNYATNKLMAFSAGTEVSNATDLSAVVVRIKAHGKGPGI